MTDEQIALARESVPDDPVRLPSGWLACRSCGVATQRTANLADEIVLESMGQAIEGVAGLTEAATNQRPTKIIFGLCADHRRTAELASELISNPVHRPLRARLGEDVAIHQVNCALDALSFLAGQTIEHMAYLDPEGLNALIRQMAHPGAQARWCSRFVPVQAPETSTRTCTPRPFAHLMIGQRQALRAAYGDLLRERVARNAPPVKIGPPRATDLGTAASPLLGIEGGCMYCGVSHQLIPASLVAREGQERIARQVWTPMRIGTEQLGGRRSPSPVSGYLCPACNEATEQAHALGPSALMGALVASLAPQGKGKLGYDQLAVDGLIGFGALVARAQQGDSPSQPAPRPNARPWEHLGDLAEITEQLGAALG